MNTDKPQTETNTVLNAMPDAPLTNIFYIGVLVIAP